MHPREASDGEDGARAGAGLGSRSPSLHRRLSLPPHRVADKLLPLRLLQQLVRQPLRLPRLALAQLSLLGRLLSRRRGSLGVAHGPRGVASDLLRGSVLA